jgi:hypothetical protein
MSEGESRRRWTIRSPAGDTLMVEYDGIRRRWRITPGGYERRALADAIAQATGDRPGAAWIVEVTRRLEGGSG